MPDEGSDSKGSPKTKWMVNSKLVAKFRSSKSAPRSGSGTVHTFSSMQTRAAFICSRDGGLCSLVLHSLLLESVANFVYLHLETCLGRGSFNTLGIVAYGYRTWPDLTVGIDIWHHDVHSRSANPFPALQAKWKRKAVSLTSVVDILNLFNISAHVRNFECLNVMYKNLLFKILARHQSIPLTFPSQPQLTNLPYFS